ncbi:MAG: beta-lactamase family protein [Lachnospiraceae bacterium]|nr:beta-lactamase family protein [Lachnospiraceae bacterium]
MDKYASFMEKIEKRRVNLHGFMVFEKGVKTFEHYYRHFNEDSLHRMYSVAKSFTAIAVGFMVDEGKIKLSDRICDHFPEYEPEGGFHPWLYETTVEDCLTMQTCYSKTTYLLFEDKDYVKSFFTGKPDHRPGCVFAYDTSAAQVMGALVEKLSGMDLMDYLREKGFDRIGLSKEAYMIKEPGGRSLAGSGLVCKLKDVAAAINFIAADGVVDAERLLSHEYIGKMTSFITATSLRGNLDEINGYGYYFWRTREPGYCMYGMGGQLALVFPNKELVFVCMADTQITDGLSHLYDAFYDHIYGE